MGQPTGEQNRWRARPVVAGTLVVAVFAVPILFSIVVAWLLGQAWSPAATTAGSVGRWLVILALSTLVYLGGDRVTRRILPLAVLLKMGMIFPGRAPRRLSVARRTGTTRDLRRRIDEARSQGISDEPTVAAEQIVALAATLSAHDRRTRGHAERVRAFTDLIAEELRLPDDDRDRLRWSALLHDVGKLTVHADILNKPGALSDEEWETMRRHPLEGARLTAPLAPWLGPWAKTIAEHHERFDGQGYPHGLAGHEISLGGRIVAVADSYDTMTSLRSYHKPKTAEAARAELAAYAGAQFDPTVVRAFLAVSVRRLHAVAPLAWIATLPVGNVAPQLARVAALGGRLAAGGSVAALGVVGLTTAHATLPSSPATPAAVTGSGAPAVTTPAAAGHGDASGEPADRPGSGAATHGAGDGTTAARGAGSSGAGADDSGADTGSGGGTAGAGSGGRTDVSGGGTGSIGGGSGEGSGGAGSGSGSSGGDSPGTTTPSGPGTVPTTIASPPGSTTTTAPPPLLAPGGLKATPGCNLVLPQMVLGWTPSPDTRVTGYEVLRRTSGSSSYAPLTSVSGRTSDEYTDTAVGIGTTYYYEIESLAGSSASVPGAPVSGTTPTLCVGL